MVKDHLIGAGTNISKVLLQGSFDGFVGLGLKGGSALNQVSGTFAMVPLNGEVLSVSMLSRARFSYMLSNRAR